MAILLSEFNFQIVGGKSSSHNNKSSQHGGGRQLSPTGVSTPDWRIGGLAESLERRLMASPA